MSKVAIFVEGYTEVVFVDRLICEIAGRNKIEIEWRRIGGGTTCARRNAQIRAFQPITGSKHFVMIHDCGGDVAVKTRMIQEYPNLVSAGYSRIICIRDVFPTHAYAEIKSLEGSLPLYVKTKPIVVDFILSVMEIEAWFLAEHGHLSRIDGAITIPAIKAQLGFDPQADDMQLRPNPAADLDRCYQIGGKSYVKGSIQATVDALDFLRIRYELAERFNYLAKLCDIVEGCLAA